MRLFGRKPPADSDPDDVLAGLRTAYATNNFDGMRSLCRGHQAVILGSFSRWFADLPPVDDPSFDDCLQTLGYTAQVFEREMGHPELMAHLMTPADASSTANPFRKLETAMGLMTQGRFEDGRAALHDLIGVVLEDSGPDAVELVAKAYGGIGRWLAVGHAEDAVAAWTQALTRCQSLSDTEGTRVYAHSLFDAHRYLGNREEAAHFAGLEADLFAAADDASAAWLRREAAIVAAGEPLHRLIAVCNGRRYELDEAAVVREAAGRAGKVEFRPQRNRPNLERGRRLISEANALAAAGRVDDAIVRWSAASDLDPYDPDPVYNGSVALLDKGQFNEAPRGFERVELLAPGWFLCRRYAAVVGDLAAGRLDPRLGAILIRTNGDALPPPENLRLLRSAVDAFPQVA